MRFNDAVFGVALLLFAAATIYHARTFPEMPGQSYGPALFPTVIGIGMTACGLVLIGNGIRNRHTQPMVVWGDWVTSPHHLTNILAIVLGLLLYIVLSDVIGFIPLLILLLTGWLAKLRGGHLISSLTVAVATTLVIHFAFTRFLLVPLPWGILEPLAW